MVHWVWQPVHDISMEAIAKRLLSVIYGVVSSERKLRISVILTEEAHTRGGTDVYSCWLSARTLRDHLSTWRGRDGWSLPGRRHAARAQGRAQAAPQRI